MDPEDAHKVIFKTPLGTYIPKVMMFGLSGAPSVFQRAMYQDLCLVLLKYPENVVNLMDDWVIGTSNTPEGLQLHREIVHFILELFELHSYFLKLSKCIFEQDHIDFLGFQIHAGCARIDPVRIDSIRQWPEDLKNKKEICQFLGVMGYQCPFIVNFAKLALPLTHLLKDIPWTYGKEQQKSVQALKSAICDDPELVALDTEKDFELQTDASDFALGAVLF